MVFPNYVDEVWLNAKLKSNLFVYPRKIAIVSNHVPQELLEAKLLLEHNGCKIDIYGIDHIVRMITPNVLSEYDLVITIGKTVQFAMCLKIPVYCYDIYGGPGYITPENLETASFYNFSGRGFGKKDAKCLVDEILNQYEKQSSIVSYFRDYVTAFCNLHKNTNVCLNKLKLCPKIDCEKILENYKFVKRQNAAIVRLFSMHTSLQKSYLKTDKDYYVLSRAYQKVCNELKELNELNQKSINAYRQTIASLKNSTSWKITSPLRWISSRVKKIIAWK